MDHLIPGLIDDLGRECLIRIPFYGFPVATSVCKAWNTEIKLSDIHSSRKLLGLTRPVFVLAQAKTDDSNYYYYNNNSSQRVKDNPLQSAYKLTVADPDTGFWAELPELSGGLPVFCGVVGSGSDFIVIGGWDPVSLRASSCVYVYNFLSGKWRKGSGVPGVHRSFFGCASDGDRTVMIAGGHDEDKNALKSVLLYDVAEDKWVSLPDMERERDECRVVFQRGMFHVISGYPTERQGSFDRSVEVFDPATWQWGPVVEDFLEANPCPKSCVAGSDGRVYACVGADVAVQKDDKWQIIAKVPAEVGCSQWMSACGDKLVMTGSSKFGEPINGFVLDLNNYKWSKIDIPKEYCGYVQSGCILEL